MIKKVFNLRNLFPAIIIVAALLVPLGIYSRIGIEKTDIIFALFGILAIDMIVERAGLLAKMNEILQTVLAIISQEKNEFFVSRDIAIAPLAHYLKDAHEIYMCGITLGRTITTFSSLIQERVEKGCKLRLAFINPDPDSAASQTAARRSLNLDTAQLMATHVDSTIASLQSLYRQTDSKKRHNIEVYLLEYPPPYKIISIDGKGDRGIIFVELYACKVAPSEDPVFIMTNEKYTWYKFFYNQVRKIVKSGRLLARERLAPHSEGSNELTSPTAVLRSPVRVPKKA